MIKIIHRILVDDAKFLLGFCGKTSHIFGPWLKLSKHNKVHLGAPLPKSWFSVYKFKKKKRFIMFHPHLSLLRSITSTPGVANTWWRHQMHGNICRVTGLCAGNSPVIGEFPHKGQWRGALMFSLISAWINSWVNNREAGDFRCDNLWCHQLMLFVDCNRNEIKFILSYLILSYDEVDIVTNSWILWSHGHQSFFV